MVPPIRPAALPIRAVTDPADHHETVERERVEAVGDRTDASVPLADQEHTSPTEPLDPSTGSEDVALAHAVLAVADTAEAESPAAGVADDAETMALEKFSATEIARPSDSDILTSAVARPSATEVHADPAPAATTSVPAPAAVKIPVSTAPDSLPPPTAQQAATTGPSPACPQCEAPMAWVEEHLRFYCKSCRMYF